MYIIITAWHEVQYEEIIIYLLGQRRSSDCLKRDLCEMKPFRQHTTTLFAIPIM